MTRHVTRLLIDLAGPCDWAGAGGAVMPAKDFCADAVAAGASMVLTGDPADAPQGRRPDVYWVAHGLAETHRMRRLWPSLRWIPRVGCAPASTRYTCGDAYLGGGFRVFQPDTAALRGWRVSDNDMLLDDWLAEAAAQGHGAVWLAGADAEARGTGLDLEMLERARRRYRGRVWLSGGAREPRHLANLAAEGGADAVIVPAAMVAAHGLATLLAALGVAGGGAEPDLSGAAA